MTFLIDQLIAFLTELQTMTLVTKVLTLASIPSLVLVILGIPAWLMTRRVRSAVVAYDNLEEQLKTVRKEAVKIENEAKKIKSESPISFIRAHKAELRDGNFSKARKLAEKFIDRQKDALLIAFRTRMDEAVYQSVEDGASAFEMARKWALAASSLTPDDEELSALIDELATAQTISNTGVRVQLKSENERKAELSRNERISNDLIAIAETIRAAQGRQIYRVALSLANAAISLTRNKPFGKGSKQHMLFRRVRITNLVFIGDYFTAYEEGKLLIGDFNNVFSGEEREILAMEMLFFRCRMHSGQDVNEALADFQGFMSRMLEEYGENHEEIFDAKRTYIHLISELGRYSEALSESENLLPLLVKNSGARSKNVLSLKSNIADLMHIVGDTGNAITKIDQLLPVLKKEYGEHSVDFLMAQISRGTFSLALSEFTDAANNFSKAREGLENAQLHPNHRAYQILNGAEKGLEKAMSSNE